MEFIRVNFGKFLFFWVQNWIIYLDIVQLFLGYRQFCMSWRHRFVWYLLRLGELYLCPRQFDRMSKIGRHPFHRWQSILVYCHPTSNCQCQNHQWIVDILVVLLNNFGKNDFLELKHQNEGLRIKMKSFLIGHSVKQFSQWECNALLLFLHMVISNTGRQKY